MLGLSARRHTQIERYAHVRRGDELCFAIVHGHDTRSISNPACNPGSSQGLRKYDSNREGRADDRRRSSTRSILDQGGEQVAAPVQQEFDLGLCDRDRLRKIDHQLPHGTNRLRQLDDRLSHPRASFRAGWVSRRTSCMVSTGCRRAFPFGFHLAREGPCAADGIRHRGMTADSAG